MKNDSKIQFKNNKFPIKEANRGGGGTSTGQNSGCEISGEGGTLAGHSGCEISGEGGTPADGIPDVRYPEKVECWRDRIPDVRYPKEVE